MVDVGSNTMRLCVYSIEGETIQELFHNKIMAGLAAYIENGRMVERGIDRACEVINQFKIVIGKFDIEEVVVFGTAAIRNVENTEEIVDAIKERTGYDIELLSGVQEACMGYYGIRNLIDTNRGIIVDIGGATTEITYFNDNEPEQCRCLHIGTLTLFSEFVKKTFLPKDREEAHMRKRIAMAISPELVKEYPKVKELYAVGGCSRAIRRIFNIVFGFPAENRRIPYGDLHRLFEILCRGDHQSIDLITRNCPERAHTIVPGMMILLHIMKAMHFDIVEIRSHGVREGYLQKRILHPMILNAQESAEEYEQQTAEAE